MAVSARVVVLAGLTLVFAGRAGAQEAASPQPCEGTLCDLYYGGRGPAPTPATAPATTPGLPPGATPLLAPTNPLSRLFGGGSSSSSDGATGNRLPMPPSEPATSNNSYMHLGGGGLLGSGAQRCEGGTLCDLLGSSSPEQPADARQQQAAAGPAPVEPAVVHRHIVHESETRPKCSSPSADPWRCYR